MPKVVSDHEKKLIFNAIYQSTVELIKEKGLRGVTVEDISKSANIAKGSFYKYYPTKEECLYDVIRKSESELFGRMQVILTEKRASKELILKALNEVYLAENSLVLFLNPNDFEALMRKLPEEYHKRETEKTYSYFEAAMRLLKIDEGKINMDVLGYLMDSLAFLAAKKDNNSESKEAMKLIVKAIADYLTGGLTQ